MYLFSLERPHGFVWKHPLPVYLTADSLRPFVCLPSLMSYIKCQIIGTNELLDQQEVAFSKQMHMAT